MKKISILAIILLANFYAWSFVYHEKTRDLLTVIFLNIGQGDSTYIEAPNGNSFLIDSSANEVVVRELSKFLPYYDRTIDGHATTHPDLDHIGGTPAILSRYRVGKYFAYDKSASSDLTRKIETILESKNIPTDTLRAGDRIMLDHEKNIYMDVLWPTDKFKSDDKNDLSIITHLVYGEIRFVMTGDAPTQVEGMLLREFPDLRANVLKLGHHGSKTSTSQNFLTKLNPDYAVISAGIDNRYGHPSTEIVERIENFFRAKNKNLATQILKTTDGSVVFKSDGHAAWIIK